MALITNEDPTAAASFLTRAWRFLVGTTDQGSDAADTPRPALAGDAVVAALPDPALVIDSSDAILAVNADASRLFPLLSVGRRVYHGLRDPEVLDGIVAARRERRTRMVGFTDPTPVERRFQLVIAPVEPTSPDGPLLLMFRDKTEALRLDRTRSDFVAHASHELRTPLASMMGFIETLQGPAREDAKAREKFLGIMLQQAKRMSRLIDDLLSLSRIELNQRLRPTTRLSLGPIVGHVLDTLAPLARADGVEFVTDLSKAPDVLGDRDELVRVVENLVENAVKYGASGKRVEIAVERGADPAASEVVVAVRDHGPGIAPEHLPRLTERFYRVDAGDSRAKGGTGLGLAIVKHILGRHGGRLEVTSKPGEGACFKAILPIAPAQTDGT